MDILSLIQSINKVALVAFFMTGIFLGVETYFFIKHKEDSSSPKLKIPDFQNIPTPKQKTIIIQKKTDKGRLISISNPKPIILLLIGLLVFFGVIYLVGRFTNQQSQSTIITPSQSPTAPSVSSEGIILYDETWKELTNSAILGLNGGERMIVGVRTIANFDIDQARIRVNSLLWEEKHIVDSFDEIRQVFYMPYEIASDESQLKIEAQLHSKSEGWLGE